MNKVSFLPNGQWELKKYDEESYGHIHEAHTAIPAGEHTVEVHPHIDHLMNIKGAIQDSGKDKIKVSHLKQMGFDKNQLQKLNVPRDASGHITADMIDKHIEGLPKQKVTIKAAPYEDGYQQHRKGQQHVVSLHLHDDTDMGNHGDILESMKDYQHNFKGIDSDKQIGWARIDPKGHHWHVDEIQSDLNNPDKVGKILDALYDDAKSKRDSYEQDSPEWDEHEAEMDDIPLKSKKELQEHHNLLSHGHDDPQHLIHSAVNQLARKYNIQSMSMDTPKDQARQSGIALPDDKGNIITNAISKVGIDNMKALAEAMHFSHKDDWDTHFDEHTDKADLTDDQKTALKGWVDHNIGLGMTEFDHAAHEKDADSYKQQRQEESDQMAEDIETDYTIRQERKHKSLSLPVHQINTYNKRPKKLGMEVRDKKKVLGDDPEDKQKEVQYHKLYKSLLKLREALKRC